MSERPQNVFQRLLMDDVSMVLSGVMREMPSERNMGAAEWVPELGCLLRRHELGWFYVFGGNEDQPPTLYFRPHPGQQLSLSDLRRVRTEFYEERTPELAAMINFAEYDAGEFCYV